ncbi:MAG TPA: flagellar hook basal-body protein [Terracidiphilus sp.]|jgi:flagellar basal-body rod protein FlgF|nr:flagellar hook basal-body protein [Terracidiphilus sp.]
MDSGYYAAFAGLMARTQALDTAAGNLANTQTVGYRAERDFFRSVLLGPDAEDSQLGQTVNAFGLLGGNRLNMAQGALQTTGNPFDLAIEGEGFFAIQTASGQRFTRDGSFHRSQKGILVSAGGEPVLSVDGQPVLLPPGDVSVGADGVVSVAGGKVTTIGIFTFPSGTELTAEGANRYLSPSGVSPALSKQSSVHQGALEAANQDAVQGTMDLILMQRQAEMMQKALTIFHVDFNKFAAEDLPRV